MPAFQALAHYNPAFVLLLGLATFAGSWGAGFAALAALKLRIPSPWAEVAAALLGAAALSLAVQIVAMGGLATSPVLVGVWILFLLVGALGLFARARRIEAGLSQLREGGWLLPAVLLLAAGSNLLVAIAPSTKIDEINYQMLPASRIVLDGGLQFYLRPWAASVVPQMGYSIAAAPLYAMGSVDAQNVWSWCLSALLAWFAARLVYETTRSGFAALLAAAGVVIGLHPSVFHTTGGTHALGDLATAGAVLAIAFRDRLLQACSQAAFLVLLSICCMVAAWTKVSLLPLTGAIMILGLVLAIRSAPADWLRLAAWAVVPWAILYLPLCLWTFWQSGSPYGPMFAGVLGPSVFDDAVQKEMAGSREVNQGIPIIALTGYVLHYPAIFPLAALAALVLPTAPRQRRLLIGSFLGAQLLIVAILLPHQARFLSGLHHALLVLGVIAAWPYVERWMQSPRLRATAVVVLLAPWLALQVYRAWFLAPVAIGIGDEEDYYRSFIALYDDFRELDRILPEDAVLYARGRLPSIYFPRPVYMHQRDLPSGRRAFALLAAPEGALDTPDCAYLRLASGCRLDAPVYVNATAHYTVFRTPGNPPETERVEVREILGLASAAARTSD